MKQQDHIVLSTQDFFGPLHNLNNFWERKDGYEIYHTWPGHEGSLSKGFIYLLKCRPGLILTISRHYPTVPFSLSFKEESTCIHFSFFLGKGGPVLRRHHQGQKINFESNQGCVTYKRDNLGGGILNCPAQPVCSIGILMEPWFISRFWDGATGEFAQSLQEILMDKASGGYFKTSLSMLPGIHVCLHEILGCPYSDARRHLFLESKVLELITLSFDQLNPKQGKDFSGFEITPDSQNFIHEARDIMIADIKNPPCLQNALQNGRRKQNHPKPMLSQGLRGLHIRLSAYLSPGRVPASASKPAIKASPRLRWRWVIPSRVRSPENLKSISAAIPAII